MDFSNTISFENTYVNRLSEICKKCSPVGFNDSEILNYFFTDTEFIFHLGVHKTATTYIQNLLNQNKYDLALKGIIVIDSLVFREFINKKGIIRNTLLRLKSCCKPIRQPHPKRYCQEP